PELHAARIARRERLLAVLDPERLELRQRVERLGERPALVDVDLQRQRGHPANGANALDVETVPSPELELQALEPRRVALGLARHLVRIAEADRPRRRRAAALEPEQPPDGQAGQLAAEVVGRRV